jgi:ribokinase
MVDLISCGAINWDINLFMDRLPGTGEEVQVKEIQRVSGGTAANVAVAAARILGKDKVAFIGALGKDNIAEEQLKTLEDEGVVQKGVIIVPGEESGQAYISISKDGDNEIHTFFGANLKLTPEHMIDNERLELIKQVKVCVIMDPPINVAKKLAELCKENDIKVIWDPGVYVNDGLESLIPVLQYVDYFILNHHEYEILLGTSDPKKVSEELKRYVKNITTLIKQGSNGCIISESDMKTIIHMDAVPLERLGLEVVNTVGCGDAFIGGFAAGIVQGKNHLEALRQACAAGSYKATRIETRGGPTKKQLEKLIDEWKNV